MGQLTSRRAFLNASLFKENSNIIRPPGSDEACFADLCTQCGDCISACPDDVLAFASDGFPELQPQDGPCTLCGDCARSCPTDALQVERLSDWPWRASLEAASCLSMMGVSCRLCQDNCDERAISFRLQPGGRAAPALDADTCTGCGFCAALCPVGAITMQRQPIPETEAIQ